MNVSRFEKSRIPPFTCVQGEGFPVTDDTDNGFREPLGDDAAPPNVDAGAGGVSNDGAAPSNVGTGASNDGLAASNEGAAPSGVGANDGAEGSSEGGAASSNEEERVPEVRSSPRVQILHHCRIKITDK